MATKRNFLLAALLLGFLGEVAPFGILDGLVDYLDGTVNGERFYGLNDRDMEYLSKTQPPAECYNPAFTEGAYRGNAFDYGENGIRAGTQEAYRAQYGQPNQATGDSMQQNGLAGNMFQQAEQNRFFQVNGQQQQQQQGGFRG